MPDPELNWFSDRIQVTGDLVLDGALQVRELGGFGTGVYPLIDYGTLLEDNGLLLESAPVGYSYSIDTGSGVNSAVTLTVAGGAGGDLKFWDGSAMTPGNVPFGRGGDGVWNATNTNWTDQPGTENEAWSSQFAVFSGVAGRVTIEGEQAVGGMQFRTDGYRVEGDRLITSLDSTDIRVDREVTATIASDTGGVGSFAKQGAGTLVLAGNSSRPWHIVSGDLLLEGRAEAATTPLRVGQGARLTVAPSGSAASPGAPVVALEAGASLFNQGLISFPATPPNNAFAITAAGGGITIRNSGEIKTARSGINVDAADASQAVSVVNSGSITLEGEGLRALRTGIRAANASSDSRVENTESGVIIGEGRNLNLILSTAEVLNAGLLQLDGPQGVALRANQIDNSGRIITDADNAVGIRPVSALTLEDAEDDLGPLSITNSGLIETAALVVTCSMRRLRSQSCRIPGDLHLWRRLYGREQRNPPRQRRDSSHRRRAYLATSPSSSILPTNAKLIDNRGVIEGAVYGVMVIVAQPFEGGDFETQVNTILNHAGGEIIGGSGTGILGTDRASDDENFGRGFTAHADEIVDNAGLIRAASGRALDLGGGADRVILRPGGRIESSIWAQDDRMVVCNISAIGLTAAPDTTSSSLPVRPVRAVSSTSRPHRSAISKVSARPAKEAGH